MSKEAHLTEDEAADAEHDRKREVQHTARTKLEAAKITTEVIRGVAKEMVKAANEMVWKAEEDQNNAEVELYSAQKDSGVWM